MVRTQVKVEYNEMAEIKKEKVVLDAHISDTRGQRGPYTVSIIDKNFC
jgi:hypothetical protein